MTLEFPHPERVPGSAVERLAENIREFMAGIQSALEEAEPGGEQATPWRQVLALLQGEQAQLQSESEAFRQGDPVPLLHHASELRLLARRMDHYPLAFAGEELSETLAGQRQRLVLTAWQITAAASGSEAAGL